MKKQNRTVLKKVRPLGNLTDIYYTYSHWDTKIIDGVEFVSVVKFNPEVDRKSTRLNSSHIPLSRMPSSA